MKPLKILNLLFNDVDWNQWHDGSGIDLVVNSFCAGIFFKAFLLAVTSFIAWFYQALQPPPPAICGTPSGAPVTAPRIQLGDGRFLAYKEAGVSKESAKYKIVIVHAFGRSRLDLLPVSQVNLHTLWTKMLPLNGSLKVA